MSTTRSQVLFSRTSVRKTSYKNYLIFCFALSLFDHYLVSGSTVININRPVFASSFFLYYLSTRYSNRIKKKITIKHVKCRYLIRNLNNFNTFLMKKNSFIFVYVCNRFTQLYTVVKRDTLPPSANYNLV